jgi:Tol biopolymer transport system component
MNGHRDIERTLDAWFVDGPSMMPDRLFDAVLDQVERVPQRRLARLSVRYAEMNPTIRLFTVLAAALLVIVAAVALSGGGSPSPVRSTPTEAAPTPSPTTSASPTTPPAPVGLIGQIAFSRKVDGNTDVYLMNIDGTGLRRLTSDPGVDIGTSWSPDGATLLFTRGTSVEPELSELFAVDVATGVERQLTRLGGAIGGGWFSPSGDRIGLEHWPVDAGLSVMDLDGSNRRLVAPATTDVDFTRGWTADGKYLYVLHDGKSLYRVEVATGRKSDLIAGDETHRDAILSPDGSRLAYVGPEPGTVRVAEADGSAPHDLGRGVEAGYLSWSPDSGYLVYRDQQGMIDILRADGSEFAAFAPGLAPVWRPGS